MRIVFMGTPSFAVPSLVALAKHHELVGVFTRPDAVRSRGKQLTASTVKEAALARGLAVYEASRLGAEQLALIGALEPELICVAAYGCIVPDELLELPRYGCINVHASLLPRWRGAAPIQRAILAGDAELGVSIMRIAHELDAGPYCRQASLEAVDKGAHELTDALAELGAIELLGAIDDIAAGTAQWTEQDTSQVSLAPKLSKSELMLNPADSAAVNIARVRASLDTSPARALLAEKTVRVLAAAPSERALDAGALLVEAGKVYLGCAEGSLELLELKPDGKRAMDARSWAAGLQTKESNWSAL